MIRMVFVMLNKSTNSFSSLLNYFVIQESLGLLFLMFSYTYFQLLILIVKVGIAPFHFWLLRVLNGVYGFNLVWFLTFQKLPFFVLFLQLVFGLFSVVLFFGIFICLFQMLLVKGYKFLLVLSSTESFNWVLLGLSLSFLNSLFVFFYYFFLMLLVIPKFEYFGVSNYMGWESVLVFINVPFRVSFFVKIFTLGELLKDYSFWFLFILFIMTFSTLSVSYWLVNLSSKFSEVFKYNKTFFMFILPLRVLLVI